MVTSPSVLRKEEKKNKFEKYKAEKDGLAVKDELDKFAEMGWEAIDKTGPDWQTQVARRVLQRGDSG